jgi:hypothetical protein
MNDLESALVSTKSHRKNSLINSFLAENDSKKIIALSCWYSLEELKENLIDLLGGIIEAQKSYSIVFDRVLTTIDFGVLHILLFPSEFDALDLNGDLSLSIGSETSISEIQAKYLVLIETLKDGKRFFLFYSFN